MYLLGLMDIAQFYITVVILRSHQQFIVWNNSYLVNVNLLINLKASYPHVNFIYLSAVSMAPPPVYWVAIST